MINLHATAIVIGSTGWLIQGKSGSGKTSLALAAIAHFKALGCFAALVADDQCLVETVNGRLIASCPPVLAARAEMRGYGILDQPAFSPAIIDGIIGLVDEAGLERMPDQKTANIAGVELPVFELPQRQIVIALPLFCQILKLRRF